MMYPGRCMHAETWMETHTNTLLKTHDRIGNSDANFGRTCEQL